MDNELTELWKQIAARPDGPLAFRFYLQPTIAALLAIRDGRRDAVAGRPAYLWSLFREKDADRKKALLRDGWHSIARVFVLALLIDIVYQIIVLHGLHAFQGILIAVMLALVPYVLLRGPVNRLSRSAHHLLFGESDHHPATSRQGTSMRESDGDISRLAEEAYLFGYPLVLMDVTRAVMTSPGQDHAPVNQFLHKREFPDASFTDVVSPNADTLYSSAWLDLSKEPVVLSVPDTAGRYYLMPMLSGWTDVFASPGKRTTGTRKGDFAIVGPRWQGRLPDGVQELRSPTEMVWLLGRTQTNGKKDYHAVHALQEQYRLTPLSAFGKPARERAGGAPAPATSQSGKAPVDQVAAMDAGTFFSRLAALLPGNPPAEGDAQMMHKLSQLGVRAGQPFDADPARRAALAEGVSRARKRLADMLEHAPVSKGGWSVQRGLGDYGTDYAKRALVALFGLGANLDADAMYPNTHSDDEGQALNGAHKYVMHFESGQLPPANAFWSLAMYNSRHFFVSNPIDRYAIGDRDELRKNADGSLDIYIQHDSPGKERESNWLPAPAGGFNLILRMYWPKQDATEGKWTPPGVQRVTDREPERELHEPDSWQKPQRRKGTQT